MLSRNIKKPVVSKKAMPDFITPTMLDAGRAVFIAMETGDNVKEAEYQLIKLMEPVTGITLVDLLCSPDGNGVEHFAEYIKINLRLLVPYVGNKEDITKGVYHGKHKIGKEQ